MPSISRPLLRSTWPSCWLPQLFSSGLAKIFSKFPNQNFSNNYLVWWTNCPLPLTFGWWTFGSSSVSSSLSSWYRVSHNNCCEGHKNISQIVMGHPLAGLISLLLTLIQENLLNKVLLRVILQMYEDGPEQTNNHGWVKNVQKPKTRRSPFQLKLHGLTGTINILINGINIHL